MNRHSTALLAAEETRCAPITGAVRINVIRIYPPLKIRRGAGGVMNGQVKYLKSLIKIGNAAVIPQLRSLKGYDIVHLHLPFFGGGEWLIRNSKFQIPNSKFIVQYHHDADARGLKGIIFEMYDKFILPRIIKRADNVIVSTMDYARHSRVAPFIDDRFVEIPFGVDTRRFAPQETRNSEQGAGETCFTILFVGSLDKAHWFKGLDVLLRALRLLKNQSSLKENNGLYATIVTNRPLFKCIIIGDGDLRGGYENMAKQYDLDSVVQFLGKVSHDELPIYYRNADCFVFPSVSRAEAFGIVVLEAMASGLPVIVSDLPGVRTLIEGDSFKPSNLQTFKQSPCGFTFPVGDSQLLVEKIQLLMNSQPLREQMGKNAREKVFRGYTVEKMIDKIEKLY